MKSYTLTAAHRTETGKKVKHLRSAGRIPATVYGKSVKSVSITVSADEFISVYEKAGETGLIELVIDKEKRSVLVHSVQRHPVSHSALHVEFHQVDLKEKVHADIPLELTGESPAVSQHLGVLLTVLGAIEVEALPTDLPEKIPVDITKLAEVNDELKVADLDVPQAVKVLTDTGLTVVKIGPLVTKEAEAQAAADATAAAASQAAAAPVEGDKAEEKAGDVGKPETTTTKEEKKETPKPTS